MKSIPIPSETDPIGAPPPGTAPGVSSAISVSSLGRDFEGKPAVRSIDLTVARGEIYGFLGPNGAGKSTTVRMLCTLLKPNRGTATVAGRDLLSDVANVRLRIGVALQEASLDPNQTGRELLRMHGRLYGLSKTETADRIDELLSLVDLGEAIDNLVSTYSGGMERRLDLACSLIHRPEILFLDEPTTGLDPISRDKVWGEIRKLNKAGTTVFLTTQYLEEADALADRIGMIVDGSIVAEGTPEELKASIGITNANLDDVFRHVVEQQRTRTSK